MKSKKLLAPKFGDCYGEFTLDGKTMKYLWDPDSIPDGDNLFLMESMVNPEFYGDGWMEYLGCGVCNGKFFTDFEEFKKEKYRSLRSS